MRPINHAAVRAAFLFLLAIAIVLYISGLDATAQGQESHSFDGKTFVLHGLRRAPIATIAFTGTNAAVEIVPSHLYQHGHDLGVGYTEGTHVTHDYYEVRRDRVSSPAQRVGWRNPLRLELYTIPVTYWSGPELPDGQAFLDIRATAGGDFLIVATFIHRPKGATP
jgi:hypothetical protein